jgi:hypothetical protein
MFEIMKPTSHELIEPDDAILKWNGTGLAGDDLDFHFQSRPNFGAIFNRYWPLTPFL